jgi:murein L,D-transpeptidase YcbB/YkuD
LKFVFPNTHNVYLHDTPARSLFARPERAFSHGCIRVSRPKDLAVYVLGGEEQGWDRNRVDEIIASRKHTIVRLKKPLPIHIIYQTVWRDLEGFVHFNRDIYGRDALLAKALFGHKISP